jgi:hypothetical protein
MKRSVLGAAPLLALALCLAAAPASAQKLYRCGNVLSEEPCADSPQIVRKSAEPASDTDDNDSSGMGVCKRHLLALHGGADNGATIDAVTRGKWKIIDWANGRLAVPTYRATVVVKSILGSVMEKESYTCVMNPGDSKVLRVES